MSLNESIVEEAASEWFGKQGYSIGRGPLLSVTYKFDLIGD